MGLQLLLSDARHAAVHHSPEPARYATVLTSLFGFWTKLLMVFQRWSSYGCTVFKVWQLLADAQSSPPCDLITASNAIPTSGSGIALQSYSYCGGVLNLTAYVEKLNYNKTVSLFFTDGSHQSSPCTALDLLYRSPVEGSDDAWEFWNINTSVYLNGLTQLHNLTYIDDDSGRTYSQELDIAVVAGSAAIPASSIQSPYAQPTGFANDITNWLLVSTGTQIATCKTKLLANINSPGAANGTVVASTSTEKPDYHYNWVRDAALTMNVIATLYGAASNSYSKLLYEGILFQYSQARVTEQNDPNLLAGLGEPKFELDNTAFTGAWGRPQNDGPAEFAATLMDFANSYLAAGGDIDVVRSKIWDSNTFPQTAPVLKDLLFVATNWSSLSFDLWEEEESHHFFNRLVSYRALVMGSQFSTMLNDSTTAEILSIAANSVIESLDAFWDADRQLILYESGAVLHGKTSYKDIAVVLGVLHGNVAGNGYTCTDERVLISAYQISTSFLTVYPIANVTTDTTGGTLGIPVGRYPEDIYNGIGTVTDGGNPWYLATAAMAELFYSAASQFQAKGSIAVSDTSLPFWTYFAPSASLAAGQAYSSDAVAFVAAISSLEGWGDAFLRRIKYHTPLDQRLSEEYNRDNGDSTGALDLTWSYASLLTAAFARAKLRNETGYIAAVADI